MKFIALSFPLLLAPLFAFADTLGPPVETANFAAQLSIAAIARTHIHVTYDPAYVRLDYPNGDVSPDKGVCSDVVIRSLRTFGIDLQKNIHEDMAANFSTYPKRWGMTRTDRNIDHRRVPNIEAYFTRIGARITTTQNKADYRTGDIVAWNLSGHGRGWMPHIGIVTDQKADDGTPLIVHNIGAGPQLENVLFDWPMTGHYRLTASMFE